MTTKMDKSMKRARGLVILLLMMTLLYITSTRFSKASENQFNYHSYARGNTQKFVSDKTRMTAPCVNRQDYVLDMCTREGWVQNISRLEYSSLLVDEKHKVIYCTISKVASTTFKRLLVANNGNKSSELVNFVHNLTQMDENSIKPLEEYTALERMTRLAAYKKFMVVRHPFDRLLSTYNNKFTPKLLRNFPKNITPVALERFPSVATNTEGIPLISFSQFLELIAEGYHDTFWDIHWASYYDVCHPCSFHYEKVVKLETADEDIGVIYSWLDYQSEELRRDHALRASDLEERLSEVSEKFAIVDRAIAKKVMDVYQKDFELFGYSWTEQDGARCLNLSEHGQCC